MVLQYETHSLLACTAHWETDLWYEKLSLLLAALRLMRITQRRLSFQLAVLYTALLESLGVVVYYLALTASWFHLLLEYTKLVAFLVVGYFFATSALRLTQRRELHKKLVMPVFALIFVVLSIAAAWAILPDHAKEGCRNVLWLAFSLGQFLYAFVFEVIGVVILKALQNKSAVSKVFRARLTRPLLLLALVYGFVSLATLAFRVFLFAEARLDAKDSACESLSQSQPRWMLWTATLYHFIDLCAPVAALAWYFTATVQPRYSLSVVPINVGSAAFDEASGHDFPAATTRLEISLGVGTSSGAGSMPIALSAGSGKFAPFPLNAASSQPSPATSFDDLHRYLHSDEEDEEGVDEHGQGFVHAWDEATSSARFVSPYDSDDNSTF